MPRDPQRDRDLSARDRDGDGATARALARAELRLLAACVAEGGHGASVAAAVAGAQQAAREADLAALRKAPATDPAVLFDLAELAAAAPEAMATAAAADIECRIAALPGIDDALREEARERYVALAAAEEDLDLDVRIALLRETALVLNALAVRFRDRELRRLARRLARRACDRVLARRLERALTPRGAWLLENTSLALLLVLFVLLLVETSASLSEAQRELLLVVDASICVFFVAEFALKLALAPARLSWFLRNAVTDLLPAIPAALWFLVPAVGAQETVLLRALRLVRITWFARYVQALRPALRMLRLLLFMAKGMDALVERFSALLNRNVVFFDPAGAEPAPPRAPADARTREFLALREAYLRLGAGGPAASDELLARARTVEERLRTLPGEERRAAPPRKAGARDLPVEHAIEALCALRPEQLDQVLPRTDLEALDRVVRTINAPLCRSLPIVRWFRSPQRFATPAERVVDFCRRVAGVLERWRGRALAIADLHGIVTGPQILDRLATALVRVTFRPARNLILFGLFFALVQALLGADSAFGAFLARFVATPVLILGSVCAVVFGVGFWLKRIAGEAADQFKLTAEASFIGLLDVLKRRTQDDDLAFLAARVFGRELPSWEGAAAIARHVDAVRDGTAVEPVAVRGIEEEAHRMALLYLHFLDGAVLHESDVQANEQLLANLSLENVRTVWLRHGRRERRRLRKLSLQSGPLLGGPYLWFRCITESVAVETAKRVTDYDRHCLTLAQRAAATPERRRAFAAWLKKRRRREAGRLERVDAPADVPEFVTTEFTALDFLSVDAQREARIERVFGRHVARLAIADRTAMIREIFGMRPMHELPREERTFNFHAFYVRKLSGGRVFLVPLHVARMVARTIALAFKKLAEIVREVLAPQAAIGRRRSGRAPFSVALRKIHRMKAPTLVEAMRLRVEFDPIYTGAPVSWSAAPSPLPSTQASEFERDLAFLGLEEREREALRATATRNARRIAELHEVVRRHGARFTAAPSSQQAALQLAGECALTIGYMTDRDDVRTLFLAEAWLEQALAKSASRAPRPPMRALVRMLAWLWRGGRAHPVTAWARTHVPGRLSRRARGDLVRGWYAGDLELRATARAWAKLEPGTAPGDAALARASVLFAARDETARELAAVRAVQSLSVLDVRNYRKLVFALGGYEQEGESRALAEALP